MFDFCAAKELLRPAPVWRDRRLRGRFRWVVGICGWEVWLYWVNLSMDGSASRRPKYLSCRAIEWG